MANLKSTQSFGNSASEIYSKIVSEQGFNALWRGNMPSVYRNLILISMNVTIYDRVKHMYMPQDPSRYKGIDFLWRYAASSGILMGLTAACTYPFDLFQTRITSDMSGKKDTRLYNSTF